MYNHFQILCIVARSLFKQALSKAFNPGRPYPLLPMSLDDAVAVRNWSMEILAEEQAVFDAMREQLLADCDQLQKEVQADIDGITLNQQARNPTYEMPNRQVSLN